MPKNATAGDALGPGLLRFLGELAKNNNREWFTANKARYLDQVQAPALGLIRTVGPRLEALSPHLVADPRPVGGSMMRIYRDIRFSKDKTPYRTAVGIHFMHDAQRSRNESLPGFFLHLAPGDSWAYAGVWQPEGPRLQLIRQAIVERAPAWRKVRAAVSEIEGESLKRPPPGFDPAHPFIEDLKRKSFTAGRAFKDSEVTSAGFPDRFLSTCEELNPLNRFLAKAVGVEY